jgi:hypothetical protein
MNFNPSNAYWVTAWLRSDGCSTLVIVDLLYLFVLVRNEENRGYRFTCTGHHKEAAQH